MDLRALDEHGYVVTDDVLLDVDAVAAELGRCGPPKLLSPRAQTDTDPWSLSGVYGTDAFPWHTDGAIDPRPPRWIILTAVEISGPTCTELLDPSPRVWASLRRTTLRAVNRDGRARHLPAALPAASGRWRLRWDPRTCRPTGGMTISDMTAQDPTTAIGWKLGRTLILDNSRLLHRRPAVDATTTRLLRRLHIWETTPCGTTTA